MTEEKITTTAILSKELYEMIRKAAYLKNVSNSEIIRQCCKKQLEIELKEESENM
jgi:hypothetical protein